MRPWLNGETRDKFDKEAQMVKTLADLATSIASLEAAVQDQKVVLEAILKKTEVAEDLKRDNNDIKSEILSVKSLMLGT